MIHKNVSGNWDYELLCPFSGSQLNLATAGFTALGTSYNTNLHEYWGESTDFITCQIKSTWATPSYECTFYSPAGAPFTTGVVAGSLGTGFWRLYITDYKLVVNADCSYTVSWDQIDGYLSINGAAESLVVTHGAYSYTSAAGAYDERWNNTKLDAVNTPVDTPTGISCVDAEVTAYSYVDCNYGGYRYQDQTNPGVWIYDEVLVDVGTAGETCSCSYALPDIWVTAETDSYHVSAMGHFDWSIENGDPTNYFCACAVGQKSGYWYRKVGDFTSTAVRSVYIRDKNIPLVDERIITGWICNDALGYVSGSSDTTTSPTLTTCASSRGAYRTYWDLFCVVPDLVGCAGYEAGGGDCPGVPTDQPDYSCLYTGTRDYSWPTAPPCSATPGGVWNLTTRDLRFLISYTDSEGAKVHWWYYLLPKGDSGLVTIDASTHYYQNRVYDDNRLRIYAIISKDDGTAYRSYSDDGAKTWSALVALGITDPWFAGGCSNDHGDCLEYAFVYDAGTSGPGKIKFQFKGSGSHTYGSVITAKDSTGTAISFVATSFHIRFGKDGAARVILTAIVTGETVPSAWWSTDVASGGGTFTRFA